MKLKVQKREITGKKVKNLRNEGVVPASVFGPGIEPTNVQVDSKEFKKVFEKASFNKFIDLEINDGTPIKVLIKDLQIHPVRDYYISIGFYKIDETRKISVDVPLNFVGESKAEKEKNGFLVYQFDTISLHCLPKDLPSEIEVDISKLEAPGDAFTASELDLPENVEFDSSVGDPTATALVYVATDQKEIIEEETEVSDGKESEEGKESTAEGGEGEEKKEGGEGKSE